MHLLQTSSSILQTRKMYDSIGQFCVRADPRASGSGKIDSKSFSGETSRASSRLDALQTLSSTKVDRDICGSSRKRGFPRSSAQRRSQRVGRRKGQGVAGVQPHWVYHQPLLWRPVERRVGRLLRHRSLTRRRKASGARASTRSIDMEGQDSGTRTFLHVAEGV